MQDRTVGICLLGCGIVGSGVVRILQEQGDLIARRTGLRFDIRHAVVRDAARPRPAHLPITTHLAAAIEDPTVDIVIELMGGVTVAADAVRRALQLGKPVITANKSLLASQARDLFTLARAHHTAIAFEASCGGGIPIIAALTHGLIANDISALVGIVNGTCNVILTRMTDNGWTYAQALAEAQKLGFAEADPAMDVSGRDTAQKLALLASLAFNAVVAESDIHIQGIDTLDPRDIAFAKELGYVVKLLAIAQRSEDGHAISLRVHPTLVARTNVLADVSGSFNAISVYGSALGHCLFYGRGAGAMPTASAVVSDLIQTALGATTLSFNSLRIFPDHTPNAAVLPFADLQSRYYLRVLANDRPGVMAQIAAVLGQHHVSISAILQHESASGNHVPIVITTHLAREGSLQQAIEAINALPVVTAPAACLRIIDQPRESAALA